MPRRGWRIGGLVLALALVGLIVWRTWLHPIQVAAPEPLLTADLADTLTQVPRSVLIAPIAFDLGPAIAQFEADVPRQFGSLDRRIRADSSARASVAFAASRSPFQVHVEGSRDRRRDGARVRGTRLVRPAARPGGQRRLRRRRRPQAPAAPAHREHPVLHPRLGAAHAHARRSRAIQRRAARPVPGDLPEDRRHREGGRRRARGDDRAARATGPARCAARHARPDRAHLAKDGTADPAHRRGVAAASARRGATGIAQRRGRQPRRHRAPRGATEDRHRAAPGGQHARDAAAAAADDGRRRHRRLRCMWCSRGSSPTTPRRACCASRWSAR